MLRLADITPEARAHVLAEYFGDILQGGRGLLGSSHIELACGATGPRSPEDMTRSQLTWAVMVALNFAEEYHNKVVLRCDWPGLRVQSLPTAIVCHYELERRSRDT